MTSRRKRILYSREEYFRSLLPDAKDEETRQAILAIIEEERGRSGDHAMPEGPAKDPVVDERTR
jgi:hypothetical protein